MRKKRGCKKGEEKVEEVKEEYREVEGADVGLYERKGVNIKERERKWERGGKA